MTARVAVAVILFVSLMLFCIGADMYTANSLEELYEAAEKAEDGKAESFAALDAKWKQKKTLLHLFLKHTESDSLDRLFTNINGYVRSGKTDDEQLYILVRELKSFLRVTVNTGKTEIENIF